MPPAASLSSLSRASLAVPVASGRTLAASSNTLDSRANWATSTQNIKSGQRSQTMPAYRASSRPKQTTLFASMLKSVRQKLGIENPGKFVPSKPRKTSGIDPAERQKNKETRNEQIRQNLSELMPAMKF